MTSQPITTWATLDAANIADGHYSESAALKQACAAVDAAWAELDEIIDNRSTYASETEYWREHDRAQSDAEALDRIYSGLYEAENATMLVGQGNSYKHAAIIPANVEG